MIEQAFGKPLEEIFSEFNPHAVGAATIGQAHEARLKGSNKPVIVKIQYRSGAPREEYYATLSQRRYSASNSWSGQ